MARALHTAQQKQHICTEARRMLREHARFADICAIFEMKPVTLRNWLNTQTRDMIYPRVANVGRL